MRCCSRLMQRCLASDSIRAPLRRCCPKEPKGGVRDLQRLEDAVDCLDQQPVGLNTYARLIRECCSLKSLAAGRRVHHYIRSSQYKDDRFLSKLLMSMYNSCESLHEAWKVFDSLTEPDTVSWNVMIGACIKHGHGRKAMRLFDEMLADGTKPDERTFTIVLNACWGSSFLDRGKQIETLIVDRGFECGIILATALVKMFCNCGSLRDARRVFDGMATRDLVSWNTMISGYVQHRVARAALDLFEEMKQKKIRPDNITFVSILTACASLGCLQQAKKIHLQLLESRSNVDLVLCNALLHMYISCGSLADAHEIFGKMTERDVISWNSMLSGYAKFGLAKEAFELLRVMKLEGVNPDRVTYIHALNALETTQHLNYGKAIHGQLVEDGFRSDVVVGTALLNMYSKCGSVEDAVGMFNILLERDPIAWNAMIAAYSQHGRNVAALGGFAQMQWEGVKMNSVTLVNLLNACSNFGLLEMGRIIHACLADGALQVDVVLGNALANMYVKCGDLDEAWKIFQTMPDRDVVSWNTMVGAFAETGHRKAAMKLFKQMKEEGILPSEVTFINILHAMDGPTALADGKFIHACIKETNYEMDVSVGNALLSMYSYCGSLKDAREVFKCMKERDVVTLNAMISTFARHGLEAEGLQLFKQMLLKGMKPDEITLVHVVDACSSLAALAEGKLVHAYIVNCGFEGNVVLGNALMNMYGKCGSFESALTHFEKMVRRDLVTWNTIIEASRQHGHGSVTIQLFGQMQWEIFTPDRVGFVSVLSACSHMGSIEGGYHYFSSMDMLDLHQTVEHYGCIVDLFSRGGQLNEAEDFIRHAI